MRIVHPLHLSEMDCSSDWPSQQINRNKKATNFDMYQKNISPFLKKDKTLAPYERGDQLQNIVDVYIVLLVASHGACGLCHNHYMVMSLFTNSSVGDDD
jgi:hypothetical protein